MNFRLHKADDILPFVIYFTVYVTVGDGPALKQVTGLQDEFSTTHLVSQFTTERR